MQTAQDNPLLDLQPSQTLDCRGMVCPAPILELSKAARVHGKQATVLEIIADDAEFPNDLRAWCRASKNTLLNLLEDEGLFVAHVGVNIHAEEKGPSSGPRTVATSHKAKPLVAPSGEVRAASSRPAGEGEHPLHTIDCRGMQCPAPILAVAKKAQQLGRQAALMEVFATDEQFPTDLKAWCRASKAQLVNVDRNDGEIRALIALGNVPPEVIENAMPTPIEEVSMPLVNVKVTPPRSQLGDANFRPTVPDLPRPQLSPPLPNQPGQRRIELPALTTPGVPALTVPRPVAVTPPLAVPRAEELRSSPIAETRTVPASAAQRSIVPANDSLAQVLPRENRCVALVAKRDVEAMLAAVTYASAAAARGMVAEVYFSFAGINLLRVSELRARVDELATRLLERDGLRSLDEWLGAPGQRDVKLVVCSTSLEMFGLGPQDVVALPNVQFGDVNSFVEASRRSSMTMVF